MRTKQYEVLCMTCGGEGVIPKNIDSNVTTIRTTETCPVCRGTKVQKITEYITEMSNSKE